MSRISISDITPPTLIESLSHEEIESVVGGGRGKGKGKGGGGRDDDDDGRIFFSRGPGNSRELFFVDGNGNGNRDGNELFFSRGPGNSRELFFFG
jgi:hypothetical protein